MPQQISWYVDKRVIYHRFYEVVTIDDVRAANEAAIALLREGTPPVHEIVDARDLTHTPFNLKRLNEATTFFREPNLGWVVFVASANPIIRFLTAAAGQIYRAKFKMVASHDEALATLLRVDSTLKDVLPLHDPMRFEAKN